MQTITILLTQAFAEKGLAGYELEEFIESGCLPSEESKVEPYDPAILKAIGDSWKGNNGQS